MCFLGGAKHVADSDDDVAEVGPPTKKLAQTQLVLGQSARKVTQRALDQYVVEYIANSVLPFHHVESEAFQSLISHLAPGLKLRCRKTYHKAMQSQFQEMKDKLMESLAAAKYVCLTADHWSGHRKGYLGATAHWVDIQDRSRKQACIALRRIVGRCTYDVLAALIEGIVAEYKITGKVTHCVTDSGSNFVKAFAEFGEQNEDVPIPIEDNIIQEAAQMQAEGIAELLVDDGLSEYTLPPHFKCAAHRFNLIATKNTALDRANPPYKRVYRSLMGKLQAMWNKQSQSVVASDKIRTALGKLFVVPNSTRWNSTYDAMRRVEEFYKEQKVELSDLAVSLNVRPVTEVEAAFLQEFLAVMKPLAQGLDLIQGDQEVCAGYLLPTLVNILAEWQEVERNDLQYCAGMLCEMVCDLKNRFREEMSSEYFKIAAALHPNFKAFWVCGEELDELRTIMRKILPAPEPEENSSVASSDEPSSRSFFWRFEAKAKASSTSGSGNKTKYRIWMDWCTSSEKDVPTALWDVYLKYNTTLPSSAAVERLFSLGKRVLSPMRTQLADETFESMVMLASNCKTSECFYEVSSFDSIT